MKKLNSSLYKKSFLEYSRIPPSEYFMINKNIGIKYFRRVKTEYLNIM